MEDEDEDSDEIDGDDFDDNFDDGDDDDDDDDAFAECDAIGNFKDWFAANGKNINGVIDGCPSESHDRYTKRFG